MAAEATDSCCPDGTQPVASTASTALTASLSSDSTISEMNINAIDVFEPMGFSPVPTDICLVGLDDNSVDEFDTPLCNTAASLNYPMSFDDAPCDAEDPCDELNDDIDEVRAPVDCSAQLV